MMGDLGLRTTDIDGLLVLDLSLHVDSRGWFKENWQRANMIDLGLPDFRPVQQNMSFNSAAGTARGFHAEPWDKLVSVANGRVFGAYLDLRAGDGFGQLVTVEIDPAIAVFVPRGVANAFQTLESHTTYSYLVNAHWSATDRDGYVFVNLADPEVSCPWPIPLQTGLMSEADHTHPALKAVRAVPREGRTLIVGAGQLGRALALALPDAQLVTRADLDIAHEDSVNAYDFGGVDTIINAAAWTAVDAAETREGRERCWATNVEGVRRLVDVARRSGATLVHVSSDYVLDGSRSISDELAPSSPLSVYGASKAAGDAIVTTWEQHYIVRTSWVVGDGPNFVRTMIDLATAGAQPAVVDDQFGRLTFADDLSAAIIHLLTSGAPYGTYNVTNDGEPQSWYTIASEIFTVVGRGGAVSPTSTAVYGQDKTLARRPANSTLDLSKLTATGFQMPDAGARLREYVARMLAQS